LPGHASVTSRGQLEAARQAPLERAQACGRLARHAQHRTHQLPGLADPAEDIAFAHGFQPIQTQPQLQRGGRSQGSAVLHIQSLALHGFGDAWIRERRTAVLVIPSVVARREGNILINPPHPDFTGIVTSKPERVVWDARLFASHRIALSSGLILEEAGRLEARDSDAAQSPSLELP